MKNEIVKPKHGKPIQEKLKKFYLQVITDACVKIAVLEICSEKNTRESVFETCVWGRFWLLKGQGFWVNSWKKENLGEKYFSDNVESSSKILWKVIPADIKTDGRQEIKELVTVSYTFSKKYLLKTWNTM